MRTRLQNRSQYNHPDLDESGYRPICGPGRTGDSNESPYLSDQAPSSRIRIELPWGTELLDRFLVKEKLGVGRWGSVYLARDSKRAKDVALKVTSILPEDEPGLLSHHHREINLSSLPTDFGNIIRVHDAHLTPFQGVDLLLTVMEYADGGTFRDWLNLHRKDQGIRISKGIKLFKQACSGIRAMHQAGLLHLDIRPENMLIVGNRLKISDFGSAHQTWYSRTGSMDQLAAYPLELSSPTYASPEHFLANHPDDLEENSNIYSLGLILYETVSRDCRPPFGGSPEKIRDCHLNAGPPNLIDVENELQEIVWRCLEKEPGDRFLSVDDLIDTLDRRNPGERRKRVNPQAEKAKSIELKWKRASRCFADEDYSNLDSLLEEILSEAPDHHGARRMRDQLRSKADQAEQLLIKADEMLDGGRLGECVSLLSDAAEIYPEHRLAAPLQARALNRAERFNSLMETGREALVSGQWSTGLRCFEEVLTINRDIPNVPEIVERLNLIQVNRRNLEAAIGEADFPKAAQLAGLVDSLAEEMEELVLGSGGL